MSHRRERPARLWVWRFVWVLIVAAGVFVKSLQPPQYIFAAGEDDELFVRMAHGFLQGHWSTSWANASWTTLAKPVGFPLFLAGAHYLAWSPLLSIYFLYVAGACLIAWSWRRMSGSRAQATVILVALVFSPGLFAIGMERIYRDSFIEALAAFGIGLAFVVAAELDARARAGGSRRAPLGLQLALLAVLAVLIGVTVGFSAITKPTWYWMVPAVLAPVAYPVWSFLRRTPHRLVSALCVGLAALLAVGSCFGVIEGTKQMNKRTYGVALVEDLSSGALARAWEAWAAVEAGRPQRYQPITRSMRLAVYQVSPTAQLLEPYLHSAADPFVVAYCLGRAAPCDGPGKYLEWALQWAAVETGRVNSEVELQRFFNEIADQIDAACRDGRLTCSKSPVLATGLPPLDQISLSAVGLETAGGLWQMVSENYPFGSTAVARPTVVIYDLWADVIPDMQPIGKVSSDAASYLLYSFLRANDFTFRVVNVALLAGILLVPFAWFFRRPRERRKRDRANLLAAAGALFFLASVLIGMGTLAVFNVGQSPTYINGIYWSDFAVPCQLCVLFGAFGLWPVLRSTLRSRRAPRPTAAVPSEKEAATKPEPVELVGSNAALMVPAAKAPGLQG